MQAPEPGPPISRLSARLFGRGLSRGGLGALPLLPLAPAMVVFLGLLVAGVMAGLGFSQLRLASDAGAAEKATAVGRVLATRVRTVPEESRQDVLDRLGQRTGTEILLVEAEGQTLMRTTVGREPSTPTHVMLLEGKGFTEISTGRVAYAVAPLGAPYAHMSLIVFAHAPARPRGTTIYLEAVALLAALLVSIAAYVAYSFSKSAHDDVDFVRDRIESMGKPGRRHLTEAIPVRSLDQVGVLTTAFNTLVERFAAAERAYNYDLAQADALDRARASFLAALSHELRTPLNAILGFADLLLQEVEGPLTESAREDIEVIRSSGGHLRDLIDDVLDLSAMEVGKLRLERKQVDAYQIACEVVRASQALVATRNVKLIARGMTPAPAYADPRRLRQILNNLVSNAAKFTKRGSIEVGVDSEKDAVHIWVTDTGAGIPESQLATIFEEFGQVGDRSARSKGTGLGLAIARRLVDMHGGRLGVSSQLGVGSTFWFRLPAEEES